VAAVAAATNVGVLVPGDLVGIQQPKQDLQARAHDELVAGSLVAAGDADDPVAVDAGHHVEDQHVEGFAPGGGQREQDAVRHGRHDARDCPAGLRGDPGGAPRTRG
jgi:hypothetical protein